MSNAELEVWELSDDGSTSVVMCVADVILSTSCQSDGDMVREIVLAETVVLSCGAVGTVVDVLVLTDVALGPTAVWFSVF